MMIYRRCETVTRRRGPGWLCLCCTQWSLSVTGETSWPVVTGPARPGNFSVTRSPTVLTAVTRTSVTLATILTELLTVIQHPASKTDPPCQCVWSKLVFSRLPECFCSPSGQEIPGGLPPDQVPQMIVISFDDAINNNNYPELERFLSGSLKNPNGCDIKTTFFVSHRYNNYSMAQVRPRTATDQSGLTFSTGRNFTVAATSLPCTRLLTRRTEATGRTARRTPGLQRWET